MILPTRSDSKNAHEAQVKSTSRRPVPQRAVHIVPYDGIGGVETAVKSLPAGLHDGIEFRKCFIACKGGSIDQSSFEHHGPHRSENNIFNYIAAIRYVRSVQPEIVIGSLWRSCLVLIALRLLGTRTKQVVFLHSPKSRHLADYLCNRIAMAWATEIWADSASTLALRAPIRLQNKARVICFLTRRIPAVPIGSPQPNFIFWGRIVPHKGLARALKIFAALRRSLHHATFRIIGPDTGYGGALRNLCRTLAIDDAVRFLGPKAWADIQREATGCSFYLQTSEVEGMALSVIEAMQLGLVPVVTPVGEIARYCSDGQNAIVVHHDERAVQDVIEAIANAETFQQLAMAAQSYWHGQPLYRDSVLSACRHMLEAGG